MKTTNTIESILDEERCSNCGYVDEPIDYKQRVGQIDTAETVPVLARCGECGYPLSPQSTASPSSSENILNDSRT
jgi:predicted Zn-ribbon and HTH transcriptional regulator